MSEDRFSSPQLPPAADERHPVDERDLVLWRMDERERLELSLAFGTDGIRDTLG